MPGSNGAGARDEAGQELEVQVLDSSALEALNRSEIDIQISTAKRYPRSLTQFKRDLLEQVTATVAIAKTMGYSLPARKGDQDNKPIKGPSVRLAEVAATAYGNIRVGARIVEVGDAFVVAQGSAHDLEKNAFMTVSISRSIVGRSGRYGNNMIQVTCQAAIAIAFREAVFKAIPKVHVLEAYGAAMEASTGKGTMAEKIARALAEYEKLGFQKADVCVLLGVKGVADIGMDELISLAGFLTSVETGELTVESMREVVRQSKAATTVTPAAFTAQAIAGGKAGGKDDAQKDRAATEVPSQRVVDVATSVVEPSATTPGPEPRVDTVGGIPVTPEEAAEISEAAQIFA